MKSHGVTRAGSSPAGVESIFSNSNFFPFFYIIDFNDDINFNLCFLNILFNILYNRYNSITSPNTNYADNNISFVMNFSLYKINSKIYI